MELSLRRLDSGHYYCEELGIAIDREAIGGAYGPNRTEWGMAAGQAFVYAQRLGDCRDFLGAVFKRAQDKTATGRTRHQAQLAKVGSRRWRTEDGVEVRSEQRTLPSGTAKAARFLVDLAPNDPSVPTVHVGGTLDAARAFIGAIPWRGETGEE